jgi:hypothetical protein
VEEKRRGSAGKKGSNKKRHKSAHKKKIRKRVVYRLLGDVQQACFLSVCLFSVLLSLFCLARLHNPLPSPSHHTHTRTNAQRGVRRRRERPKIDKLGRKRKKKGGTRGSKDEVCFFLFCFYFCSSLLTGSPRKCGKQRRFGRNRKVDLNTRPKQTKKQKRQNDGDATLSK